MENSLYDILDKYFTIDHSIYPMISDAHKNVSPGFYISYHLDNDQIELWANDEDTCVCICKTRLPDKLERMILAFIN